MREYSQLIFMHDSVTAPNLACMGPAFSLWSQSEPIHRLGHGKFWNLGDAEDMPDDSFEGRFAGLLPPRSKEV
jgi:hypothetical protein